MKPKPNKTQTLKMQNSFHDLAEDNLKLIAENLNNYLKRNKNLSLEEQNMASSIIHKYTTSYTQLKSIETKNRELYIKEQNLNLEFKTHNLDYGPFPFPQSPDSQDTGSSSPSSTTNSQNNSPENQNPTTPPPPANNCSYGYAFNIPKPQPITEEMLQEFDRKLGIF
ncbi:MAG: hypothetical protein C5B43_03675 [Verrucomicrobia bacterium]|nr:MAG: hypothetical protein C5B43_03675 [Verrucomicrobiota bacterium]